MLASRSPASGAQEASYPYSQHSRRNLTPCIAPAVRLAKEWWLATSPTRPPDTLTPIELVKATRAAVAADLRGQCSENPLLAALQVFCNAGWHTVAEHRWETASGVTANLTEASPQLLRRKLAQDTTEAKVDAAIDIMIVSGERGE